MPCAVYQAALHAGGFNMHVEVIGNQCRKGKTFFE